MARILLVEDDAEVLPLLKHILLHNGYDVASAETVARATALLHSRPFDLAICDVKLTDGSGLEVADLATAVGVKAVVVTGHALDLRRGSLAPYDYLLKPLRGPELLAEIARRLAERDGGPEIISIGATGHRSSKPTH
jgi:two-component system, NtrC family, response regulator PilR